MSAPFTRTMSLTLFLFEVEESEKAGLSGQPAELFALNFRQFHGARVALPQSPILRSLRRDHYGDLSREANKT